MQQKSNSSKTLGLGIVGFAIGGLVGFLMRPSAMLVGQLPFDAVVSRGATLQGLDKILVPTAQASFNIIVVGALIGAVVGLVAGRLMSARVVR